MRVSRAAVLGLTLVVSGCAREGRADAVWIGKIGPDTLEGRVRVVGSEPFSRAIIEPDEGDAMVVSGPYEAEVRRLAGARVRATGRRVSGGGPDPSLEATSYEILSVDGEKPRVGRLERDGDGWYLRAPRGEEIRLAAVSEPLAERPGAFVWLILDDRDGVARYGILREPVP